MKIPPLSSILRAFALLLVCVSACFSADDKAGPAVVIPITDTAALKAHVGKNASVSGRVERVGMSKSGMIVFINFEGVRFGGFSAVVRSASLPEIEGAAGANLDAALPGRKVSMTGIISLYKEAPQIELRTADQIKVAP